MVLDLPSLFFCTKTYFGRLIAPQSLAWVGSQGPTKFTPRWLVGPPPPLKPPDPKDCSWPTKFTNKIFFLLRKNPLRLVACPLILDPLLEGVPNGPQDPRA